MAIAATGTAHAGTASAVEIAEPLPLRPDARMLRAGLSVAFTAAYFADIAQRFGNVVAQLSGGRLGLEFANHQISAGEPSDAGRADIWFCRADELSVVDGAFSYFSGLPMDYGLSAEWHDAWLGAAGGQLFWDELGAEHGLKPLSIGHTGASPGAWTTTDWVAPRDITSTRAAASGLAAAVLRRAGAEVTALPPSAQVSALATGEISFAEPGLPKVAAIAAGFGAGNSARHLRTGIASSGSVLACCLRTGVWTELDGAEQTILTSAAAVIARETAAETAAHQALVAPHLGRSRNIAQAMMAEDVRRALNGAATGIVAELAARSAATRHLHDAYFGFRTAATGLPDPLSAAAGIA